MDERVSKVFVCSLLVFCLTLLTGCSSTPETTPGNNDTAPFSSEFASYKEVPVSQIARVKPYTVNEDLSNVTNRDRFDFSPQAKNLLIKNGFVVVPSEDREFFSLYEINRYESNTPNFVTTDALLHNYHLYFSYLLRNLEKTQLLGELASLTEAMLAGSMEQYQELKGTEWENAALRNVAFFAVGAKLLDLDAETPDIVSQEVRRELELINAHSETFALSPVMNIGADDINLSDGLKEDIPSIFLGAITPSLRS